MNAKDLVVDHAGQRQVVEHVGEVVPDRCVAVLSRALGVEAVRLSYTAGFMITPDEVDAAWVA